jgi:hypothetical protein
MDESQALRLASTVRQSIKKQFGSVVGGIFHGVVMLNGIGLEYCLNI